MTAFVAGGSIALVTSTGETRAAVSMGDFAIEDATYGAPDNEMYSPYIQVDTAWEYSGVENAAEGMIALLIDGGILDTVTLSDVASPDDSGTTQLGGPVTKALSWDPQDWKPNDNSEVSHPVTVEIRFEVRTPQAETIAKAKAMDTTAITVYDAGPTYSATIGGSGDVLFQQTTDGELHTPTSE